MKLLQFIRRESAISIRRLVVMAGIAGLSNALVLAIINAAVENATNDAHELRHLLLFVLVVCLYVMTQKYIMVTSASEIESILHRVRVRLADKIRHCDLAPLERVGRSSIYASVSRETQTISQAALGLVVGCQAAILIFFTVFYLAWLSVTALVLFLTTSAVALVVYFRRSKDLNRDYHESMLRENKLFEALTHMLDGFKEVKMSPERSDDLQRHIEEISDSAAEVKIHTQVLQAHQFLFSQTGFYVLVALMVFVVPKLSDTYNDIIVKATTAILFLIGPISNMVGSVPIIAGASAAVENIDALEEVLDQAVRHPEPDEKGPSLTFEKEIRFESVFFRFTDPKVSIPFSVGPVDVTVRAGEVLFVSGGNGSGKSTFLKLLTALYYPSSGVIRLDGAALSEPLYPAYRRLFTVIYSDYHLFDRLYGFRDVDGEKISQLLAQMELEGKTAWNGEEFTTLDLSTGQKKRLALLVSLLEDKPIYVFDEWAADQDPHFRRRFYEELLEQLKARGKTVVAVTHDDRYFHCADRLLKMEEGRFVEA